MENNVTKAAWLGVIPSCGCAEGGGVGGGAAGAGMIELLLLRLGGNLVTFLVTWAAKKKKPLH